MKCKGGGKKQLPVLNYKQRRTWGGMYTNHVSINCCSFLQLNFIRNYLSEQKKDSDIPVDQTQIEEDMIIEANR